METYKVTLTGTSPLLMHRDNLAFSEKIKAWQIMPENKEHSKAGDDRSPAWTWIGCLYHDGQFLGMDSDNLMTMLREGGAKLRTGKKNETYKKQTQYGLLINDNLCSPLYINGQQIPVAPIEQLIGKLDFSQHLTTAEELGFELLVKRAKIGANKHVRVRPMFRNWQVVASISVIDPEVSGITQEILQRILDCAGAQCGLCDWRPSSKTPGQFGRFQAKVETA